MTRLTPFAIPTTVGVVVALLSSTLTPTAHACSVNVIARAGVAAMTLYTFNDSDPMCWAHYGEWGLGPNSSVVVSCNGNACQIGQNVPAGCPDLYVPCNYNLIYYIDPIINEEQVCYNAPGAAACDTARHLEEETNVVQEPEVTAVATAVVEQPSNSAGGKLRGSTTTVQP